MQHTTPEDQHDRTITPPQMNASSGSQLPIDVPEEPTVPTNKQPLFYTQEDDLDLHLPPVDEPEDPAGPSAPFVLPFQHSAAMPTITHLDAAGAHPLTGQPPIPPTPAKTRRISSQVVKVLLIVSVVLITIIGTGFFVLAQSATPSRPTPGNGGQTTGVTGGAPAPTHSVTGTQPTTTLPTPRPTAVVSVPPAPNPGTQYPGTSGSGTVPPSVLPTTQSLTQLGWTQAGLTLSDAFEALRTGATFTDREMSYDYRNIGTPTNHSGTLTGSTFLLTPGGKVRFAHNDKRAINNTLYNQIRTGKIIQQVMNAQPTLVQFRVVQVQGQSHSIAWVNVAFEVFQSKIDPASGNRMEHLELDPATGQPVLHQMVVVLVRILPQNQGANAPMGGTGWLVNTYALDAQGLPGLATTPSL